MNILYVILFVTSSIIFAADDESCVVELGGEHSVTSLTAELLPSSLDGTRNFAKELTAFLKENTDDLNDLNPASLRPYLKELKRTNPATYSHTRFLLEQQTQQPNIQDINSASSSEQKTELYKFAIKALQKEGKTARESRTGIVEIAGAGVLLSSAWAITTTILLYTGSNC